MYPDFKPHQNFRDRGKGLLEAEIEVVEFDAAFGGRETLVSHVRVRDDPWAAVSTWNEGDIKVMEVVAATKTHAMGIIRPGIQARVMLYGGASMLPPSWMGFDSPLPGDEVAGFFRPSRVDHTNRIVELDFTAYIRSFVSVSDVLVAGMEGPSPLAKEIGSGHVGGDAGPAPLPNVALRGIHRTLIVDDHKAFLESLSRFMDGLGCGVSPCSSQAEAERALTSTDEPFDLAIIDIHLEGINDFRGLEVASRLGREYPQCRIILISGEEIGAAHDKVAQAEDVRACVFIAKPFGIHDLLNALEISSRKAPRPISELLALKAPVMPVGGKFATHLTPTEDLADVCESLRQATAADAVVLFSISPVSYAVEIEAKADPRQLVQKVQRKLDRSPVRDVAIDGEEVFTAHASGLSDLAKHRWLVRAYRYESCIGVPVTIQRASPVAHALFAFATARNRFSGDERPILRLAAQTMGHILRSAALTADLRQSKPFELMGKVYGSMAHELTSAIPDEFLFDDLTRNLAAQNMGAAADAAATVRDRSRRATGIVQTFRAMARGQRDEVTEFPVEQALATALRIFQPEAKALGSVCRMAPYEGDSCVIRMRRSGLEQALYNLLLNAAQQIARLRCLREFQGEILVELKRLREEDRGEWARIYVHDNGPGIHRSDFERVFDIHYTTKEDGCGMGLDFCRTIAESVKNNDRRGAVRVRRSILLGGTTFEVRLPI
jgi:signal transduction histidine kinase/ActR/RegA family two-component response regulator